jgi:tetratricopeptide (TPR) repeat protein
MPFQQQERSRLEQRLSKEAIALAMQGSWEEAVKANENIIEIFPASIDAYNRLGRALTELGEFAQAKEAYTNALELAPDNIIAKKNLARLAGLSESKAGSDSRPHKLALEFFLTELGKAGVLNLYNPAPKEVLAKMGVGDQVQLKVKGQHLVVESEQEEYLGEVEPKHGLRLIKLIEGGNSYAAAIFRMEENEVKVIIREMYQHPSQAGRVSFPVGVTERLRSYIEEAALGELTAEESEALEEIQGRGVEDEDTEDEDRALPDGFSILSEKGEIEP